MIRVGEIVKNDSNPLMNVSGNYEEIVKKLAGLEYSSDEKEFLAVLVISQTEKQYKKYLIKVLQKCCTLNVKDLINAWQDSDFTINDEDFKSYLSADEFNLLSGKDLEAHLEEFEKDYPGLFKDGLNTAFYHKKKKGMVYLRRMVVCYLGKQENLSNFKKLVLHFVAAQMLDSWESSCIHLGKMILEDWDINKMSEWYNYIWPIYIT